MKERLNVGMFEGLKAEGKNAGGGVSAPSARWSFDRRGEVNHRTP
jgi:hypothetical protein